MTLPEQRALTAERKKAQYMVQMAKGINKVVQRLYPMPFAAKAKSEWDKSKMAIPIPFKS